MVRNTRLLGSAAVGLAAFVVLGATAAFAAGADHEPTPDAMMFPRPGDTATYAVEEFHIAPADGYLTGMSIQLTWMPERWVADGDLNLRLTHPLLLHYERGGYEFNRESYFDAATGEPILDSGRGPYYGMESDYGLLGSGLFAGSTESDYSYDMYTARGGLCGARNPLQDGQDAAEPLQVQGYCGYLDEPAPLTYESLGTTREDGRVLHNFADPARPYLELSVSPDTPFPVRVTTALADVMGTAWVGHERMYELTLTSWQPGEGQYTHPDAPLLQDGPGPVPLVPRTDLLLDHEGYPFPLPFPEAYAKAVAEPGDAGLAGFLADHPDAYVAEGYSQEWTDEHGAENHAWYFVVTDGTAWAARAVREGPANVAGIVVPGAAVRGTWVSQWQMQNPPREAETTYLSPDELPDDLPRPVDVLDRHAFVEGGEVEGARYLGWTLRCANAACLQPSLWMGAGYQDRTYAYGMVPEVAPSGYDSAISLLAVGNEGYPTNRYSFSSERPSYGIQEPAEVGVAAKERPYTGATLALPGPGTTASLGILALVVAGLYHAWPALKAAPLALFSRIAAPRVLEHPARARILAAIEAEPGVHFLALSRRLEVGNGTLDHHLRKLEQANLVRRHSSPGYVCFFPAGTGWAAMQAAPALRSDGGRAVAKALADQPGATSREIAAKLGLAPSTVAYHLKRLQGAGVVTTGRAGSRLSGQGERESAGAAS